MTERPAPSIVIAVKPAGSASPDITDLAQTLKERVHDYEIRIVDAIPPVDTGRRSQRGAAEFDALATIAVSVPWEALTGAVATVVLETLRDWTAKRFRHQEQVVRELQEQEVLHPPPLFALRQPLKQPEEKRSLLRGLRHRISGKQSKTQRRSDEIDVLRRMRDNRIPMAYQHVAIYGPRDQLLAIVEQHTQLGSPRVEIFSPPRWPGERRRPAEPAE